MNRRQFICSALGAVAFGFGRATWAKDPCIAPCESPWLVSAEEVARSTQAGEPLWRMAKDLVVDAPRLVLLEPAALDEPLHSPFPIHLEFEAADGAHIVPESFRALYGFFKLDITDRILKHAAVRPEGLTLDEASIPAGRHELLLRIDDDHKRRGEMLLKFSVA